MLATTEDDLRLWVVSALAERGSHAALPALRESVRGLSIPVDFKSAGRAAIRAIETRSRGKMGTLSVIAESDRGMVSMANEAGAVSIDED